MSNRITVLRKPVPGLILSMDKLKKSAWYVVSVYLLILYLTYFHLLNVADGEQVKFLGAGFATAWLVSCFVFQTCFRNRFEFAIHTLLTIDFYLESLVPYHSGLSFYFCAAGFWTVFLIYHHLPIRLPTVTTSPERLPGL
jgi:hypothetical protein